MSSLPKIKITLNNTIYGLPLAGTLSYQYSPFKNLLNVNPQNLQESLKGLTIPIDDAGLSIENPIVMSTEVAYDNSINLIVSDTKNPPKIVNSRFYLTSSTEYEVADRNGNLDTNIYSSDKFKEQASLIKNVSKITKLAFDGLSNGGTMPVGSYTFYFKFADSDDNETNFISESGKVVCHIGSVNNPSSIRGGQGNENSEKSINFTLSNVDLEYNYIKIYYTRTTDLGSGEITTAHKITDKFKLSEPCKISISGYENHEDIDISEINTQLAYFDSVKTQEVCQNLSFVGNITNNYDVFADLQKYSLYITPSIVLDKNIGNLSSNYVDVSSEEGYEYFNAKNIYYKLGYWDEEIYKFGIVYILNNYTLSPVFGIRGIKELALDTSFGNFPLLTNPTNFDEDFIIENTNGLHNAKGVFKINHVPGETDAKVFDGDNPIKPIGLKFIFNKDISGENVVNRLSKITKGFFIVRQKRLPTILAQGIAIRTSKKAHFPMLPSYNYNSIYESFLSKDLNNRQILKRNLINYPTPSYANALLCPEASLRAQVFNNFFNSSEFKLKLAKYKSSRGYFYDINLNKSKLFDLGNYIYESVADSFTTTNLTLVEPGIELIGDDITKFSSQAGNPIVAHKYSNPLYGDPEDLSNDSADSATFETSDKVRGIFNSFIGCSSTTSLLQTRPYNIFQSDYNWDNWQNYFKVRINDSSPYFPVSDRLEWADLVTVGTLKTTDSIYRGDCYINTYTHRMMWNFIDSEMPTNKKIVDPYTWYKNYKIVEKASTIVEIDRTDTTTGKITVINPDTLKYRKVLPLFTYKENFVEQFSNEKKTGDGSWEPDDNTIIEPDGKKFKKYSEINGLFGFEKINKPDVNAVGLGHWASFKICSNVNLSMRDLDYTNPMEEAEQGQKRGFYPLQTLNVDSHIPESNVLNAGLSKSLGDKQYFAVPNVPFIKTNFSNRIHYSNLLINSMFQNGNRVFESKNYQDYTMEHGALVKLIEWYGTLIAVMEHGVLMIPVNERAMMTNAQGENVYINTDNVLPKNPKVLSNMYGSLWHESIVKTQRFIYGIDTVGKKIWRTNGEHFEIISDLKIQKFLNDNIHLHEANTDTIVGVNFIKSHYNAFKQDIMFVFKYGNKQWNLCWNETLNKWVTQYTWFPEFSENINNIFYTFANEELHEGKGNYLYKHGFAGTEEELGNIYPTKWYDEQHPFEFEFIVIGVQGIQKIFDNLKIISNSTAPEAFFYEVVGEGFSWNSDKERIYGYTSDQEFLHYLLNNSNVKKLPYINFKEFDVNNTVSFYSDRNDVTLESKISELRDITIREHNKTKEKLVNVYQKALDIKEYGRLKGNMQYLEDAWNIQIQPITFKYVYLKNGNLAFTGNEEMKIRDKYIKIRVKYKGDKYAIINALKTLFTLSYA